MTALCWSAAFWVVLVFARVRAGPMPRRGAVRLVAGLALGATLAHLGWLVLHLHYFLAAPGLPGASVLFVPLGPWLTAPRGAERDAFLYTVAAALPPALAVARLGCVFAGCCGGARVAVCEVLAWLGLTVVVSRAKPGEGFAALAIGMGAMRLALDPLRGAPLYGGEALVPAAGLAGAWLCAGLARLALTRARAAFRAARR